MTDFQTKKLAHYFNILDFDKSGTLERQDYLNIGENLCILWGFKEGSTEYAGCMDLCNASWDQFCEFMGLDPEGHATREEWLSFADQAIVNGSEELYDRHVNGLVRSTLDFFDTNDDGHISLDEYVDLFMAYRIEIRYSAKAFTKLDLDGDDLLDIPELEKAFKQFFRSDNEKDRGNWLFGFWEMA